MRAVFEGFFILIIFQAIGVYCFGKYFIYLFPTAPNLTINILASSAISPVIAITYLYLREKFIPKYILIKDTIAVAISGIVLTLLVCLTEVLVLGSQNIFVKQILSTVSIYYFINIFWFILWGPVIEETFFRGYIYEILRPRGETIAVILSSTLFVLPHVIFSGVSVDSLIVIEVFFLYLRSIIFTFTYRYGGLLASIIVHVFVNAYFVYLNYP